jgi:hypothetical protein
MKKIAILASTLLFIFFGGIFPVSAAEPTLSTTLPNTFVLSEPAQAGATLDYSITANNIPAGPVEVTVGFFDNTNNVASITLEDSVFGIQNGYIEQNSFQFIGSASQTFTTNINNPSIVPPATQNINLPSESIDLSLLNQGSYVVIVGLTHQGQTSPIFSYGQSTFQIAGSGQGNQNQTEPTLDITATVTQVPDPSGQGTVSQVTYTISGQGFNPSQQLDLDIGIYEAQNVSELSDPNNNPVSTDTLPNIPINPDGSFQISQTFTPSEETTETESFVVTVIATGQSFLAVGGVEFSNISNNTPHAYTVVLVPNEEVVVTEGGEDNQNPNENDGNPGTNQGDCVSGSGEYCLLQPIGAGSNVLTVIDGDIKVGDYLNVIFKMGIAIAGILGVLMIVVGGFQYMTTDSFGGKSNAKSTINQALGGVILALTSWLLLSTLDPDLVNFTIGISDITPAQYEAVTGNPVPTAPEVSQMTANAAAEAGVNECVAAALLAMESGGNPLAIGHDENVEQHNTRSFQSFKNSVQFYLGGNKGAGNFSLNDDTESETTNFQGVNATLGLDWRYSHGIGLLQLTFFPPNWSTSGYINNPPSWSERNNVPTRVFNGVTYTPAQVLDAETNLEAGLNLWASNYNSCNNNPQQAFVMYNGGSCSASGAAQTYGQQAMNYYNNCING